MMVVLGLLQKGMWGIKMNKALNQARAISFLTLLSLDSIPLKDLRRISPDWVLWLQDYYKSQGKIKLENIPFYLNLRQFESVFKKILVKDDLPNFSIHLSSVKEVDEISAESDFLYIPADTAELIARYREIWLSHNTRNFYQDTFKLDTFGYFVSNIQIIRNEVDSLKGTYNLIIPEKILK